jgi:hypothetical protein
VSTRLDLGWIWTENLRPFLTVGMGSRPPSVAVAHESGASEMVSIRLTDVDGDLALRLESSPICVASSCSRELCRARTRAFWCQRAVPGPDFADLGGLTAISP